MQNNYLNYLCYCYANSLFSGPLIIRILNSTGLGVESYNFPSNIFLNCQISSKTNLWWNSYISNINLKLSKTIINTISMKSSDFLNTFTWKILLFMFLIWPFCSIPSEIWDSAPFYSCKIFLCFERANSQPIKPHQKRFILKGF